MCITFSLCAKPSLLNRLVTIPNRSEEVCLLTSSSHPKYPFSIFENYPSTDVVIHLSNKSFPLEQYLVLHSHPITTFWYSLTQTLCIMKNLVSAVLPICSNVTKLNGRRPSKQTQPSGWPSSVQTTSGWCGWLRNPANRSDKQAHMSGIYVTPQTLSQSSVSCLCPSKPDHCDVLHSHAFEQKWDFKSKIKIHIVNSQKATSNAERTRPLFDTGFYHRRVSDIAEIPFANVCDLYLNLYVPTNICDCVQEYLNV